MVEVVGQRLYGKDVSMKICNDPDGGFGSARAEIYNGKMTRFSTKEDVSACLLSAVIL